MAPLWGASEANRRIARSHFWITVIVVLLPTLGFLTALVLWLGYGIGFGPVEATLFGVFHVVTLLGVGVGFHRYHSHHSFEAAAPLQWFLGIAGSMASQGPPLYWAAIHRRHHQFSDKVGDTHSPYFDREHPTGGLRGLWHAHTGWLFDSQVTDWGRYVPDLLRDRIAFAVNRHYFLWVFLGLALPTAIGGVAHGSLSGALFGFLWGGLARIFTVHHCTWVVNSIGHVLGSRPARLPEDQARNNGLLALITFGDGWHNNHHAFPTSAMHGLRWWQVDLNGYFIRLLGLVRLTRNIKIPTAADRKRRWSTP